jgi:putative Mn2+ efflux pump MntP
MLVERAAPAHTLERVTGSALKLAAFVLPLGLDTLGVAIALGLAGLPARRQTQVAFLFATFEAVMPLIGVAVGVPLGQAIGHTADYVAAGLVAALGVYILAHDDEDGERLLSMTQRGIYGAAALGVSISLDELAIGFSAGLLRLPLLAMVIAISVQAFVVTQIGVRIGRRAGRRWQESAERVAGAALVALGIVLLVLQLTR